MRLKSLSVYISVSLYLSGFTFAYAQGDAVWVGKCKLAQAALQQTRLNDAEKLFEDALEEARKFGEGSSRVGITLGCLAGVYQAQGKFPKAEDAYESSIKIKEKELGATHPSLAVSYNNLASLYSKEGKSDKAVPLMRKALALMEKQQGKDSPDVLMIRSNLAQLSSEKGDDALGELKSTLAQREKSCGANSMEVAQSLNNLGEWYRAHDQPKLAEPLYQRSLSIAASSMGKENLYTCTAASNLGALYLEEKKYDLAEPLILQAFSVRQKLLPKMHPDLISSMRDCASLYRSTDRVDKAKQFEYQLQDLH